MAALTPKIIAESIYALTDNKKGSELKDTLQKVVSFLHRRRLMNKSDAILLALTKIINKKEKIVEARVVSAKELTNHDKHELKVELGKKYKANEIILEEKVDKDVLGGVRIEVEDELIDLTARNRMIKLKEYLTRPV